MINFLYDCIIGKKKGILVEALKGILYFLSIIYAVVIKILIFFSTIKIHQLECKVISVGNITVGGTGKTSLVELIAKSLKKKGHKVAILTRGYGKKSKIKNQKSKFNCEVMGDEPYMLYKNLDIPVIVNKNRLVAAKEAMDHHGVDAVILDDGFQQWKIFKDLEIITIDAVSPFGNRYLLPRGLLREPLPSLNRADICVLTKTNLHPGPVRRDGVNPTIDSLRRFIKKMNTAALIVESIHKPLGFYQLGDSNNHLLGLDILNGKRVTLFSGIADHQSFEKLILSLGMKIGPSFNFIDHHNYEKNDINKIIQESNKQGVSAIITTEKDAVRLVNSTQIKDCKIKVYVLKIGLEVVQNEAFFKRIHSLY